MVVFEGNILENEFSRLLLAYQSGELYLIHNLRECDMRKLLFGFSQIHFGRWNKEGDGFALAVTIQ